MNLKEHIWLKDISHHFQHYFKFIMETNLLVQENKVHWKPWTCRTSLTN